MVFYLSLLPALIAGQELGATGYIIYAGIMLAVTSGVFTAYALLAARVREFLANPAKLKRFQQANALILAAIALMILYIYQKH
jgi:threonine/homoserine/homoserine lactone efflux protein